MRILHSMVTTVEKLPSLRDSYLLTFTIESRALSVSLAVGCVEILLRVTAIYMPHPNEINVVLPSTTWDDVDVSVTLDRRKRLGIQEKVDIVRLCIQIHQSRWNVLGLHIQAGKEYFQNPQPLPLWTFTTQCYFL